MYYLKRRVPMGLRESSFPPPRSETLFSFVPRLVAFSPTKQPTAATDGTLALALLLLCAETRQIRRTRRYKFLRFVGKAPLLKSDTNQELVLKQYPRYEFVGMSAATWLNGGMAEQLEWYGRGVWGGIVPVFSFPRLGPLGRLSVFEPQLKKLKVGFVCFWSAVQRLKITPWRAVHAAKPKCFFLTVKSFRLKNKGPKK